MSGGKKKQDFAGHAKFEILIRKPTGDKEIPGYRSIRGQGRSRLGTEMGAIRE